MGSSLRDGRVRESGQPTRARASLYHGSLQLVEILGAGKSGLSVGKRQRLLRWSAIALLIIGLRWFGGGGRADLPLDLPPFAIAHCVVGPVSQDVLIAHFPAQGGSDLGNLS